MLINSLADNFYMHEIDPKIVLPRGVEVGSWKWPGGNFRLYSEVASSRLLSWAYNNSKYVNKKKGEKH